MQVFVAICDVESTTGGGQAIYRQIFRRYPRINFTYLMDRESDNFPRPPNVQGLRIGPRYIRNAAETSLVMECFCWAKTIAETLRGRSFDVVEIPDFMSDFGLLPVALAQNGAWPTIVVSLHGLTSRALAEEWPPIGRLDPERIHLEHLLFGQSDVRYGISQAYLDEWLTVSPLATQFVNPLAWISVPKWRPMIPATHAPDLQFVGRTERRKGPDLFVESLWRLPREAYRQSTIIGPSVLMANGSDSNAHLQQMILSRQLNTIVTGQKSIADVLEIYASRSVTILPSRNDSLNLVALESLLAGCPTVIGTAAGVCRFLEDHLPSVPFTKFDLDDLNVAANELLQLLRNYDETRDALAAAVQSLPETFPLPDLEAIYSRHEQDLDARDQATQLYLDIERSERATRPSLIRRAKQWVARSRRVSKVMLSLQNGLTISREVSTSTRPAWTAWQGWRNFQRARRMPQSTKTEVQAKLAALQQTTHVFGRQQLWSELAKATLESEQPLIGAAYALRAMRLSGQDSYGFLNATMAALRDGGFPQEAHLAGLMYGDETESTRHSRLLAWLRERQDASRILPEFPVKVVDDRRGSNQPVVAVIIAMEAAEVALSEARHGSETLLSRYLRQFGQQSLIKRRVVEVVVVEYRQDNRTLEVSTDTKSRLSPTDWPLLSLRLTEPATQGQAWNQGLRYTRAPYITLLSLSEALRPLALEQLVGELDAQPDLDWIQPHTLEMEYDFAGRYFQDLAYHDRTDFDPALIHLDHDALSRTGALYRRRIHDRHGYFDGSLRVASDIEFIKRVAPFLKIAVYPQTLCLVQFPRGRNDPDRLHREIESLRARDVFRTTAGIQIDYERRPERLLQAIKLAWNHRPMATIRSHGSMSSDVEYAARLADYAAGFVSEIPSQWPRQLHELCSLFRRLESAERGNSVMATTGFWQAWNAIIRVRRQLAVSLGQPTELPYFQDARFERDSTWIDSREDSI